MSLLDDIMKALDKIDDWRKVRQLPARTDELEARIAVLEKLLDGKRPGDACKACGATSLRLSDTRGPNDKGNVTQHWVCKECNEHETRVVAPIR